MKVSHLHATKDVWDFLPLNILRLVLASLSVGSLVYTIICNLETMSSNISPYTRKPIVIYPTQSLLFLSSVWQDYYFLCYTRILLIPTHGTSLSKTSASLRPPCYPVSLTFFLDKKHHQSSNAITSETALV